MQDTYKNIDKSSQCRLTSDEMLLCTDILNVKCMPLGVKKMFFVSTNIAKKIR